MSINQIHVEYIVFRSNFSYNNNNLHYRDSSYMYTKVSFLVVIGFKENSFYARFSTQILEVKVIQTKKLKAKPNVLLLEERTNEVQTKYNITHIY